MIVKVDERLFHYTVDSPLKYNGEFFVEITKFLLCILCFRLFFTFICINTFYVLSKLLGLVLYFA